MPKTAPSLEHQVSFTQSSISKPFELPCGHLYHQACLLELVKANGPLTLSSSGNCPLCRGFFQVSTAEAMAA